MATFLGTFSHDGVCGPACWGWCGPCPSPFTLSTPSTRVISPQLDLCILFSVVFTPSPQPPRQCLGPKCRLSTYSQLTLYRRCGLAYGGRGFVGPKKETSVGLLVFDLLCGNPSTARLSRYPSSYCTHSYTQNNSLLAGGGRGDSMSVFDDTGRRPFFPFSSPCLLSVRNNPATTVTSLPLS